jgi:signal transduction histidine kinase
VFLLIESELYQTEEIFKLFLKNIRSGVVIYETVDSGENFIIRMMNKSGLDNCKVSRKEIIDNNLSDLFPNVGKFGLLNVLKRVWKTGKPEHFPTSFYQDKRIYGWIEMFIYRLPSKKIVTIFETQTKLIEVEKNFKKKVEFEKTISSISSRFVNPKDIDEAINSSLKDIGLLSQASRSYVFLFDEKKYTMSNTHEWVNRGVNPQKEKIQNIPMNLFPYTISKIKNGEILNIANIEDLPPEASAEKDEFLREDIKSLIFSPLKIGENIVGFIGFDNIRAPEKWNEDDLNILKLSSQIIGNALKRVKTEKELENLNKELKNIINKKTKELQKSENEKSVILESISEHIVFQNLDNTIIWVNKAAADSVNAIPEDLVGRKCYRVWNNRSQPCEGCPIIKSLNTNQPEINEMHTQDDRYWVVSGYPVIDKKNKITAIVEVTREITKEKISERKLIKSEDKYRKAYYQANLYRDIFAHDINNILQNISSSVELSSLYIHNPEKLSTIKELYNIIDEQVNRAKKLISNVRKITELDESEISLEKIDINQILNNAIEFLKSSFQKRDLNIQINTATKKNYVFADNLLLDVFENILINAVRHNNKPKIDIIIDINKEKKEDKEYVKMEFKDNGIGVSDYRKKIIFERGTRKKHRSKGMGLGLSLVKKIIDIYKGEIWVEDRVKGDYKQGSNFIVLIPSCV